MDLGDLIFHLMFSERTISGDGMSLDGSVVLLVKGGDRRRMAGHLQEDRHSGLPGDKRMQWSWTETETTKEKRIFDVNYSSNNHNNDDDFGT